MEPSTKDKVINSLSNRIIILVIIVMALGGILAFIIGYEPEPPAHCGGGVLDCGTNMRDENSPGADEAREKFEKLYGIKIDMKKGYKLFKQNCEVCHRLNKKKLCGPGLEGVFDRAPSEDWVYHFIRDSDSLIKTGDPYAVKLFNDYKQSPMTSFTHLNRDEIVHIMALIHSQRSGPEPIVMNR